MNSEDKNQITMPPTPTEEEGEWVNPEDIFENLTGIALGENFDEEYEKGFESYDYDDSPEEGAPKLKTSPERRQLDRFNRNALILALIFFTLGTTMFGVLKIRSAKQATEANSVPISSRETFNNNTLNVGINNSVRDYFVSTKVRREMLERLEESLIRNSETSIEDAIIKMTSDINNPLYRVHLLPAIISSSRQNQRFIARTMNESIDSATLIIKSEDGSETYLNVDKNLLMLFFVSKQKALNSLEENSTFRDFRDLKNSVIGDSPKNGRFYSFSQMRESWENSLDHLAEGIKQVEGVSALEELLQVEMRHLVIPENLPVVPPHSPTENKINEKMNEIE